MGNEAAVAHVGFFNVFARFYAHKLGHEAVANITVVFGLGHFGAFHQTEFHHFIVGNIVEGKEVGARLFEGGRKTFQGVGSRAGQQLARAVSQTFV